MEIDQQLRSQSGSVSNFPVLRRGGYDRSYNEMDAVRGRNNLPRGRGRGGGMGMSSNRRWSGTEARYSNQSDARYSNQGDPFLSLHFVI